MTNSEEAKETPEEKESAEEEDLPGTPVFLQDAPPTKKKMDMIKWGLMHDVTEKDLVDQGFNPKTVRMAAYDLEKEGYRKRPAKSRAVKKIDGGGGEGEIKGKAMTPYSKSPLMTPTKPIPPEFLIDQIHLPMDGAQAKTFETGMKFGASMLVLGVRVAQELGNMGLQQAKPIMDMANAMRQGEAAAAKGAAAEAAILAAEQVKEDMMPTLAGLAGVAKKEQASGDNPVKRMANRMLEPMMERMMNMFMPGTGGNLPEGWTRTAK